MPARSPGQTHLDKTVIPSEARDLPIRRQGSGIRDQTCSRTHFLIPDPCLLIPEREIPRCARNDGRMSPSAVAAYQAVEQGIGRLPVAVLAQVHAVAVG